MPRPRKVKKTAVSTAAATKSITARKQTKKSTANVSEMMQSSNDKASAEKQVGRGRKVDAVGTKDLRSSSEERQPKKDNRRDEGTGRRASRSKTVSGNSQDDVRTGKAAGVKRTQKMREKEQVQSTNSRRAQRISSVERQKLEDDDFLERHLSAQNIAKWQTMTKTSQEFLNQIADAAISVVLNETNNSNFNDVQNHLNNLRKRLMANFASLKVPNKRQPNYKDMEKHTRQMEEALVEASNQVECLEKEIDQQQTLLEEKEDEIEQLETAYQDDNHDDQEITKKLHPLLQEERADALGLPPLRRRHRDDAARHNLFEDVGNSCQQQVVKTLHRWNKQQGQRSDELAEFVDAVSTIHAALPS